MKRRKTQAAILVFWLVMMGWLIRYEAFPGRFAQVSTGYRGILSSGPVVLDSWLRIDFQGKPIGISHTQMDTNEKDPNEQYIVNNQTHLQLNIMGEPQRISVTAEAALDVLYQLQRFSFDVSSRGYTVTVTGRRFGHRTFVTRIVTPAGAQSRRVQVPDDAVLYSPFVELSLSRLKPGQQLRIRTLDPASLSTVDVVVRALGRERIKAEGRDQEATVLVMDFQGFESKAWMDGEGRILRQETPFGWTMEACTAEEALTVQFDTKGQGEDILREMAVPCAGTIGNAREARELKLRLTGVSLPAEELSTGRQTVDAHEGSRVDLTVRASRPPSGAGATPPAEDLKPWLESTAFVQANHPDVVARARAIVGNRTDPVAKARAIFEWVYRKVEKQPTASLPSALDVLREMEGDCNEHTYLFVALARAVGLPAQIRVGLVYNDGAFYYHAWPAVFAGEWWEMDPTLGQESVDATHVSLLEGEFESQLKLMGLLGKLKVEVLPGGQHD
jgi:hypothetical protein